MPQNLSTACVPNSNGSTPKKAGPGRINGAKGQTIVWSNCKKACYKKSEAEEYRDLENTGQLKLEQG
ncbi:hypothetical protein M406DRAFT_56114 [Cryphonectria parasitica EP155]|uniref:Uncharacterized protein n=1 Tax=Cryphonectria parasitica (strain ATCC 38755 / EP155) TaxID=660469 RepID=A0A9P5CSJ8_CRYP1|nr:uncharacterized protein M406DRAFT_56114 [Cryphonectria parasitica EP155]KAF3768411.1 hypothetical protein M406DRAFT_56114 [Cryphonectria parasitica EP155]